MNIEDIFEETYSALTVNKLRTGLTMLGIIIGIASVIAMISIGQGSEGSINARINSLGSNLILVSPGAPRGVGTQVSTGRGTAQTLTLDDEQAIESQVSVAAIAPEEDKREQVLAAGTNTNTTVVGTVSAYTQVRNLQIASGSFISDQDNQNLSRVAVLGPSVVSDLFPDGSSPIGQMIRINDLDFQVVGTTVSKGGTGFTNADDMIYIPLSTMQTFLSGDKLVSEISVEATSQSAMTSTQNAITTLLLARHNISNPALADFQVLNQADILSTASSVTNTFTILLASVAGISLLVGGIGIMNMMLTTVTERTKEIGLRKAIGANKSDIVIQFLVESFALTFLGGIVGIALGWAVTFIISDFAGIPTSVSWWSVILAFGVSSIIGIIFGYYPSQRAAGLNPIEALRYE